jgi:hypothetical protein
VETEFEDRGAVGGKRNQILERDRWSHGNLGGATMIAR